MRMIRLLCTTSTRPTTTRSLNLNRLLPYARFNANPSQHNNNSNNRNFIIQRGTILFSLTQTPTPTQTQQTRYFQTNTTQPQPTQPQRAQQQQQQQHSQQQHQSHQSHTKYLVPPSVIVDHNIDILPEEEKFFSFLRELVDEFQLTSTLRVAGGWVRDKLLGIKKGDIDITVDDMTGSQFCEYIVKYKEKMGGEQRFHVVKANPQQSKHLETAIISLFGLDIDFVHLRTESYANKRTRIPTRVNFGTPLDDAKRRDFTVNSMFYNIMTNQIEDWTGKGMSDLTKGILRTPLSPLSTIIEDPLRALRSIRFHSTLGFRICEELEEALSNTQVVDALEKVVSSERIGIEIDKMMKGPRPLAALQKLIEFRFYIPMFKLNGVEVKLYIWSGREIPYSEKQVQELLSRENWGEMVNSMLDIPSIIHKSKLPKMPDFSESQEITVLAALAQRIENYRYRQTFMKYSSNNPLSTDHFMQFLFKDCLKFSERKASKISKILKAYSKLRNLVHDEGIQYCELIEKMKKSPKFYTEIVLWVREYGTQLSLSALILTQQDLINNTIHTYLETNNQNNTHPKANSDYQQNNSHTTHNNNIINEDSLNNNDYNYSNFICEVEQGFENLDLWAKSLEALLLNGHEVSSLIWGESTTIDPEKGKLIRKVLQSLLRYQILNHPTSKNDAIRFIKSYPHKS